MGRSKSDITFTDNEGIQPYSAEDLPPDREVITTPYDAPVRTLLSEIKDKTLIVNPLFQRRSVWTTCLKSRLIESLLMNIPIPVLYFAEDDDGTRVVVDGQQRLRSIEEFFSGAFRLRDLQLLPSLNGRRWTDLTARQSRLILNRTLRCVVISPKSDTQLRFEMFERLNTLGMTLTDQELRNCVYRGALNDLLEELATNAEFLRFLGIKEPDKRLRHHELILRFFALRENVKDYRPPLKKILSDFMNDHRKMEPAEMDQFRVDFITAWKRVNIVFDGMAFRRFRVDKEQKLKWDKGINRAVYDIQMLSLKDINDDDLSRKAENIAEAFVEICLKNTAFTDTLSRATADRARFYLRLLVWGKKLRELGFDIPYLNQIPKDISL